MENQNLIDMVRAVQDLCFCILKEIDPVTQANIARKEICRSIIHKYDAGDQVSTVVTSTIKKKGGRSQKRPFTDFQITQDCYTAEELSQLWKVSAVTARKMIKKLSPGVRITVKRHAVYYPAESVKEMHRLFNTYFDALENQIPGQKKRYNINIDSPHDGDTLREPSDYTLEYQIAEENRKLEETEGPEYWPDPTPACFKEN